MDWSLHSPTGIHLFVAGLRVTPDLREPPDLRVRRAREDPPVRSVPLDHLVPVEPE